MFTSRILRSAVVALACLLAYGPTLAADPDFRVNQEQYPGSFAQYGTGIASDAAGNFVTTWVDWRSDEPMGYFQIFDPTGVPQGSNRLFDDHRLYWWGNWKDVQPDVGLDATGNILITAVTTRPDMNSHVVAWSLDPNGSPVSGPIQVSTDEAAGDDDKPWEVRLAMNAQGNGVIVWNEDYKQILWGQFIDINGNLLGDNFMISDSAVDVPRYPIDVVIGEDNSVYATSRNVIYDDTGWVAQACVWTSEYGDPSFEKIVFDQETLYAADSTYELATMPDIAYHESGKLAIVWTRAIIEIVNPNHYAYWGDEHLYSVRAADGTMLIDSEILVDRNESLAKEGFWADVAAVPTGFAFGLWNRADTLLEMQLLDTAGTNLNTPFSITPGSNSRYVQEFDMLSPSGQNVPLLWQARGTPTRPDIIVQGFNTSGGDVFNAQRVHDDIGSIQSRPAVVVNDAGVSLVLWVDDRTGIRQQIYGRILDANKQPMGDDFLVSQQDGSWISDLSLAANTAGNAVAVWTIGYSSLYNPEELMCQRFDGSDFAMIGDNFVISDPTYQSSDFKADIAVLDDGRFAVAYRGTTIDTWNERPYNLYLQFFDASGTAQGNLHQVNSSAYDAFYDSRSFLVPSIAVNPDNTVGIAWVTPDDQAIFQKYQYPGMPIGSNTVVADWVSGFGDMAVAGTNTGHWFLAWDGVSGTLGGVYVGCLDATNNSMFTPIRVADEENHEATIDGTIGPDNAFVVAYDLPMLNDHSWDFDDFDIFLRRIDTTGLLLGTLFRVNADETTSNQMRPDVFINGTTFAAVWEDDRTTDTNFDIYARILDYGDLSALPGDFDLNGSVNITDVTQFVNYLFASGPPPMDPAACDMNEDGSVNMIDLTILVQVLF